MAVVAVNSQDVPRDFLRYDPDTGSVDVMVWGGARSGFRVATADDLLDLYILENAPADEACEFDGRGAAAAPNFS